MQVASEFSAAGIGGVDDVSVDLEVSTAPKLPRFAFPSASRNQQRNTHAFELEVPAHSLSGVDVPPLHKADDNNNNHNNHNSNSSNNNDDDMDNELSQDERR